MINDLEDQKSLWDRTQLLERLKKIGIPVAKSFVVLRGNDKVRMLEFLPMNQKEIESQAEKTKDRGEYYIEMAKKLQPYYQTGV